MKQSELMLSISYIIILPSTTSMFMYSCTVLNGSSMLLMWSAPYTLDNVPITGYNINDYEGTLIDKVVLFS